MEFVFILQRNKRRHNDPLKSLSISRGKKRKFSEIMEDSEAPALSDSASSTKKRPHEKKKRRVCYD
jgi:hypothetical protein